MYRLKLSTSVRLFVQGGRNESFLSELKEVKRQGFDGVEISLGKVGGYKMSMERCILEVEDGLKAVLDEGLVLNSIHLPFQRFIYISSCDEGVRAFASNEMRQLMEKCDLYHPNHYVFHSKVGKQEEGLWELRKPALVRTFNEMVDATKSNVCMENMVSSFPSTSTQMLEILQQVEGGKCCVDMNHFLQEDPADAILALGNRVATIHVSDNDGVYEQHWLPKQGINDWMKIIGALEKIGYQSMFTYEAEVHKYGYTYAEVRRNYEELFEEYNKRTS